MKFNNKIEAQTIKNKASCLRIKIKLTESRVSFVLAIKKAKSVIKKIIIKFIDLDFLKMLVIINCFCIFAL
ncbi:MAG: hypothetical protein HKO01_03835 [Flaviramulus sp.]|nr:hypothetical protein [Flaviramulus sp.]